MQSAIKGSPRRWRKHTLIGHNDVSDLFFPFVRSARVCPLAFFRRCGCARQTLFPPRCEVAAADCTLRVSLTTVLVHETDRAALAEKDLIIFLGQSEFRCLKSISRIPRHAQSVGIARWGKKHKLQEEKKMTCCPFLKKCFVCAQSRNQRQTDILLLCQKKRMRGRDQLARAQHTRTQARYDNIIHMAMSTNKEATLPVRRSHVPARNLIGRGRASVAHCPSA